MSFAACGDLAAVNNPHRVIDLRTSTSSNLADLPGTLFADTFHGLYLLIQGWLLLNCR